MRNQEFTFLTAIIFTVLLLLFSLPTVVLSSTYHNPEVESYFSQIVDS